MIELNKKMETEVALLSGDYEKLKLNLESYQVNLSQAMDRFVL